MLTEQFIASIGTSPRPAGANVAKDAAIFIHEFQPLQGQRTIFKKSATPRNCLAVSSTHIFAAQAEKAVVHIYSREKGNQEAIVPFTERITSLALACSEAVLVLGTGEGRILLWEVASGRLVVTSQSHLQAVTALAVDPTQNFLLSTSKDSTVHVWSLPALLSFVNAGTSPLSPLKTFTSHRAEVVDLVLGRSSTFYNIAVSASKDKQCFVWDYHSNDVLRTYLLPAVPTCLALDAGDRAIYVGYEDGSLQQLDLYHSMGNFQNKNDAFAPIQPAALSRWVHSDNSLGAALSLSISFDGCTVTTGHESGAVLAWDVANGSPRSLLQAPLPGPVTNLHVLPVTGFSDERHSRMNIHAVMKPKVGVFDGGNGTVPSNYALNVVFASALPRTATSAFERALTAPSFPTELLDEGLNDLITCAKGGSTASHDRPDESEDFMALDNESSKPKQLSLAEQNASLKAELEALRRLQKASFEKIDEIKAERKTLLQWEQKRLQSLRPNGNAAHPHGALSVDAEMDNCSSSSEGG